MKGQSVSHHIVLSWSYFEGFMCLLGCYMVINSECQFCLPNAFFKVQVYAKHYDYALRCAHFLFWVASIAVFKTKDITRHGGETKAAKCIAEKRYYKIVQNHWSQQQ